MDLCLYHPQHGYYAQAPTQVGKRGDFFTSVSCGPLFGRLIAEKIAGWWRDASISGPWRIIEPGANNAALAADILQHLRDHHADAYAELTYVTVDPLPVPRQYQELKLSEFSGHAQCLADVDSLPPLPGFVLANEVLDAFSFHWLEFDGSEWRELWVESAADGGDLSEHQVPLTHDLPETLKNGVYPAGYRTELRDDITPFLLGLKKSMTQGRMLFFDYGFAEPEYYDPQRKRGTLRVYRQHQASENALVDPGLADITAHVDFTAVMRAAHGLGLHLVAFEPQEFMLSRLVPPLLERKLWQQQWQNNFHSLVHPSQLGGKFHAIELSWNEGLDHNPTGLTRLAWKDPAGPS